MRLLVTVTVQVTVLAPILAASLHWLITVIGVVEVCVKSPFSQIAPSLHAMLVTIVARPIGLLGSSGLYVKSLVIVTVQVTVLLPPAGSVPTLLH